MTTNPPQPVPNEQSTRHIEHPTLAFVSIWHAPLVPIALAVTTGIVADRLGKIPLAFSLVVAMAGLLAWFMTQAQARAGLTLCYLLVTTTALGAAHHHWYHDLAPADDIRQHLTSEPRPIVLRGRIERGPFPRKPPPATPLQPLPLKPTYASYLETTHLKTGEDWVRTSGLLQLSFPDDGSVLTSGLMFGDEVEVAGQVSLHIGAMNPGEFEFDAYFQDRRIRGMLRVQRSSEAVVKLSGGGALSVSRLLAGLHAWSRASLMRALKEKYQGLAIALLLGDGAPLALEEKEAFTRTAVIHALVISGQHLLVLGLIMRRLCFLCGCRRRLTAIIVSVLLFGYALLTGGEPPIMRAAIMVLAGCGAILLRRQAMPANLFALAWLGVIALDPTDVFHTGCQLSFLCVFVLYWGIARQPRRELDPLEQLVEATRPQWQRLLLGAGRTVGWSYVSTAMIWAAAMPLVASKNHLISPVGILIGPPIVLLTSIGLIAGLLVLLTAPWSGILATPFINLTEWSLGCCSWLVQGADALPGSHWYVGDIPTWWLVIFYLGLIAFLVTPMLLKHWRWAVVGCLGWCVVGLAAGTSRSVPEQFRCTFLAVGHGCCVVMETPDDRTLIYDVGTLGNRDVAQRIVAPFLWQRGIRRIDEVFLSHADLDHFNGLVGLLDRFSICQVSCTPSFQLRDSPGLHFTIEQMRDRSIPIRVVQRGDRLTAGPIDIDVLHPPAEGPPGNENTRSLVLKVTHRGHTLLLTGDLEGLGLLEVRRGPPPAVDVMQAPHHGSLASNQPELLAWAQPRAVVSSQRARGTRIEPSEMYSAAGAWFLRTGIDGAVTVEIGESVTLSTFKTGQRLTLPNRLTTRPAPSERGRELLQRR